ncbi:hypothetical protein cyc_06436 [Cyclospora cayetanensis]|uniref:Uncharacterized protein n=1 Tax=Cyclospora cayetanensis TaxID=88456 RepID=A0A1D3D7L8_9EIME|nr:hypothetical protein cyc_06436 [Cyclospora cayetanensis]
MRSWCVPLPPLSGPPPCASLGGCKPLSTTTRGIAYADDDDDAATSGAYLIAVGASGSLSLSNWNCQGSLVQQALVFPTPVSAAAAFVPAASEPSPQDVEEQHPVLIAAAHTLQMLLPVPFRLQLRKLLLASRVSDALGQLNASFPLKDPKRAEALQHFHLLAGWSRFASLNFSVAFQHFAHAPLDLGHLLSFWHRLWPSWLQMPLLEETQELLKISPCALVPPPKDLQDFVTATLAMSASGSETKAQAKAKEQVLIEHQSLRKRHEPSNSSKRPDKGAAAAPAGRRYDSCQAASLAAARLARKDVAETQEGAEMAGAAISSAAATEERQQLRRFLHQQSTYDVHVLLKKIGGNADLIEERALLHGKAGEHE